MPLLAGRRGFPRFYPAECRRKPERNEDRRKQAQGGPPLLGPVARPHSNKGIICCSAGAAYSRVLQKERGLPGNHPGRPRFKGLDFLQGDVQVYTGGVQTIVAVVAVATTVVVAAVAVVAAPMIIAIVALAAAEFVTVRPGCTVVTVTIVSPNLVVQTTVVIIGVRLRQRDGGKSEERQGQQPFLGGSPLRWGFNVGHIQLRRGLPQSLQKIEAAGNNGPTEI